MALKIPGTDIAREALLHEISQRHCIYYCDRATRLATQLLLPRGSLSPGHPQHGDIPGLGQRIRVPCVSWHQRFACPVFRNQYHSLMRQNQDLYGHHGGRDHVARVSHTARALRLNQSWKVFEVRDHLSWSKWRRLDWDQHREIFALLSQDLERKGGRQDTGCSLGKRKTFPTDLVPTPSARQ